MNKGRKCYSAKFKSKVALEAVKGMLTMPELATKYDVHPSQIRKWKQQLISELPEIFEDKRKRKTNDDKKLIDQLFQRIGQLSVEVDWLKKKVGFDD